MSIKIGNLIVKRTLKEPDLTESGLNGRLKLNQFNGAVFHAYDPDLEGNVVVKFGKGDIKTANKAIEREYRITKRIKSRHVPFIHYIGQIEGISFLVIQYFEKGPLSNLSSKFKVTYHQDKQTAVDYIRPVLLQIAKVLKQLEEQNRIHGDVSLNNIFVTKMDGEDFYVLGDYGVSVRFGEVIEGYTALYKAPELSLDNRTIAQREHCSDQYSCCLVVYHLLSGKAPKVAQRCSDDDEVTKFFESLPDSGTKRALLKGSRIESANRYPNMAGFIAAIEKDAIDKEAIQKHNSQKRARKYNNGEILGITSLVVSVIGVALAIGYGEGYLGENAVKVIQPNSMDNDKKPSEILNDNDKLNRVSYDSITDNTKRLIYKQSIDEVIASADLIQVDILQAYNDLAQLEMLTKDKDYVEALKAKLAFIELKLENPKLHNVVKDQTFYKLQSIYRVCIVDIQIANGLVSEDLAVGQVLTIPVWLEWSGDSFPANCPQYRTIPLSANIENVDDFFIDVKSGDYAFLNGSNSMFNNNAA